MHSLGFSSSSDGIRILIVFQAKEVVKANHLSEVITVLHGRVEVQLPFEYPHLAACQFECCMMFFEIVYILDSHVHKVHEPSRTL